jgi:putative membrane protein
MHYLVLVLKGMAMGAANVIPGVSGGTIAFITGIYERFITALKNIDLTAIRLLFSGQWRELAERNDLRFLFFLFLGVGISIITLAGVMEWAFAEHEALTLAFFFGLIVASVIGVGRQIAQINVGVVLAFLVGSSMAVSIAFLPPASANDSFVYLLLCGAAAICSMVLPGISGSYILLLMGNYMLVMTAIKSFDFAILIPIAIGVIVGLVLFSRLLSWLFTHHKNITIALLTGFVAGSLLIIWPWKETIYTTILGKEKAIGYKWIVPEIDQSFLLALSLAAVGFLLVWIMERVSQKKEQST